MSIYRMAMCVLLIFLTVYIAFAWARPLVAPDESRYAIIPLEMIEKSDYVVPRLAGIRYFEKPVGGYWLVAGAMNIFGSNAFALRLPAALSAGLTAVLLGAFVRRSTRRKDLGLLSAAVYLTMIMVVLIGTTNILDGPFASMVVGSIVCSWIGLSQRDRWPFVGWFALAGVFCGAAFLIKGFLAIVLPAMVIGPYLLWERKWITMLVVPWVPLLAAAAVALPWAVVVHGRAPEFWHEFFWVEHVQRFTSAGGNQHAEPFWFFMPIVFGGMLPWTLVLPIALMGWRLEDLRRSWVRYAVCWFCVPFVFFSVASGKLPTYILPVMPPLAAFIAVGLIRRFQDHRRPFKRGDLIPGSILILLSFVVLIEWPLGNLSVEPWGAGGGWHYGVLSVSLLVWGVLDWAAVRATSPPRRVILMALSPMLLFGMLSVLFPTNMISERKSPMAFIHAHHELLEESDLLVSDNQLTHSLTLETKRFDALVLFDPSEFDNGLNDESESARLIDINRFRELIRANDNEIVSLLLPRESYDIVMASDVRTPDQVVEGVRLVIATWISR